ncbi:DUF484 family protein [Glaciecola siphonariae]|uniref:DUF484 family protein n=1 Tax=Glaciecola siphonariae TaxID=521012 RepID=A0ABV9LZ64_9ALTE
MSNNQVSTQEQLTSDADTQDKSTHTELSTQAVAEYLRAHPDFFLDCPDVLADLHVHHQSKGVVSLTQLQSEQYRDKIKSLKKQLEKLISNAKRNETIYTTYAKLNYEIVQCESFESLEALMSKELCESLGLSHAHIYPFMVDKLPASKLMPEIQQRGLVEKKLNRSDYYFGRLGLNEKQLLFPGEVAESVALTTIGKNKPIALLAIASANPLHFTPDMDTTLLNYLRDFLSFHLPKLL